MPVPRSAEWTAADLDHMPDDGLRYEVLNGQLVVNAAPKPKHQWVIRRLGRLLDSVVAADQSVLEGVGLLIGDDEPIPDLIVVEGAIDWEGRGIPAGQAVLVVEVVSRSTTLQDRLVKPVVYAQAGVPAYWRIETNPFKGQLPGETLPVLFASVLGPDGTYQQTHRVAAGAAATIRTAVEITIDPADLLPGSGA
ncbi:Uma2 family endonuclease [Nocardia thailandica]|uniref:Uma2 family endonuclease n=2 Tax=Nocardia thailandica TaxID=257275 RepID=A0ABW6PMF4_9NOCA